MKYRSIFSQISKSAMTPSFRGRMAWMWLGVRPIMRLASAPTARGRPSLTFTATTDGSLRMMPRPRTYTSVFAVPRSTAMSRPSKKNRLSLMASIYLFVERGPSPEPGGLPPLYWGLGPRLRDLALAHKATAPSVPSDIDVTNDKVTSMSPATWCVSGPARKEDLDLARRRLGGIRPVDEILGQQRGQITANRSRRGFGGVRRPHQGPHDAPGVLGPLHHQHHRRRSRDESRQLAVEGLVPVLLVVPGRGLLVDPTQLGGDDPQSLALEAEDDLAGEPTLDGVGLADHQGAIHDPARLSGSANWVDPTSMALASATTYSEPVTTSVPVGESRALARLSASPTVSAARAWSPRARAASAIDEAGSARGDGAVHATTVRTPAGRSASSMALGSRPWSMPIT